MKTFKQFISEATDHFGNWKKDVQAEHGDDAEFHTRKSEEKDKYSFHETHAYDKGGSHVGTFDHTQAHDSEAHTVVPRHVVAAENAHSAEIIKHYGKKAHDKANIGWGTDDGSISSKVYPHGKRKHTMIVTTHYDEGGHEHSHERYDDPERQAAAKAHVEKMLGKKKH